MPGREAQQLGIYIGWVLHRTAGGIVARALFVIPSIFVLWTLSYIYVEFGNVPAIAALFYGLKPAVTAIVLAALLRIARRALRSTLLWIIALLAFLALFFFQLPFPIVVLGAACIGLLGGWFRRFSWSMATSRRFAAAGRCHSPRADHDLGHIRTLFSVGISGRAVSSA